MITSVNCKLVNQPTREERERREKGDKEIADRREGKGEKRQQKKLVNVNEKYPALE